MTGKLDGESVVRPSERVYSIVLDGESVLLDLVDHDLRVLNVTATDTWVRLDGSTPLGVVAAELAARYAVPCDTVLTEIVALVTELAEVGAVTTVR